MNRRTTGGILLALSVLLGIFVVLAGGASAEENIQCWKHDPPAAGPHGHLNADGTAWIMGTFPTDGSWAPFTGWASVTVKGGPDGQVTYTNPVDGGEYFTPGLNPAGQHYAVSHVTVCKLKGVTTTTVVIDTTSTVIDTTTTTALETTTTALETTTTAEETTTTPELTTTTSVQEQTTVPDTVPRSVPQDTTTTAQETTTTAATTTTPDSTSTTAATTTAAPAVLDLDTEQFQQSQQCVEDPPGSGVFVIQGTDIRCVLPGTGLSPGEIQLLQLACLMFIAGVALLIVRRRPATV